MIVQHDLYLDVLSYVRQRHIFEYFSGEAMRRVAKTPICDYYVITLGGAT